MKTLPLYLVFFTIVSCATPGNGSEPSGLLILDSEKVQVRAEAVQRGRQWSVRSVVADTNGHRGARSITIAVFDDKDGDGSFDRAERLGGWHFESSEDTERILLGSSQRWRAAESREALNRLFVETTVGFSDGSTVNEVRVLFE